jgi:hypothetical protein
MLVEEIIAEYGSKIAFKRTGGKVKREYRCTSGPRKGQVRASPSACNAPYSAKKAYGLRRTKAKLGGHRKVMSKLTKKRNPASVRAHSLNKGIK